MIRAIAVLLTLSLSLPAQAEPEVNKMPKHHELVSFKSATPATWRTVNDGVMGGISRCSMQTTADDQGLFTGTLSLANNGGFASVRTTLTETDLSAWAGLELRVRGDGRTYQVRLRTNGRFDGVAYRAMLPTKPDEWTTVRLSFADFEPTFRGRILRDVPPLDIANVVQLTLMLADKTPGPFKLTVASITAWPAQAGSHD